LFYIQFYRFIELSFFNGRDIESIEIAVFLCVHGKSFEKNAWRTRNIDFFLFVDIHSDMFMYFKWDWQVLYGPVYADSIKSSVVYYLRTNSFHFISSLAFFNRTQKSTGLPIFRFFMINHTLFDYSARLYLKIKS
jgi:hypothetical protein